jgi:hypothetical protein
VFWLNIISANIRLPLIFQILNCGLVFAEDSSVEIEEKEHESTDQTYKQEHDDYQEAVYYLLYMELFKIPELVKQPHYAFDHII